MTVMTAETTAEGASPVIEVTGDEVLTEFAKVMLEWGHYRTAAGLRYPTQEESRAAVCRIREHAEASGES